MGWSRKRWFFFCFILLVLSLPIQAEVFESNGLSSGLYLFDSYVRLGELKTDPIDPALEYFEAEEALSFFLWSLFSDWQLFLSGTDFISGMDQISLERMEWKITGGEYRKMPPAGSQLEIMRGRSLLEWDSLSFRLVLRGDESPGLYNSILTITMVFP
ncbi:MAG TPA: hypothetical protein GXZ98_08455 [Firmicutes bacterium]|jgi:hypothetical protein|nr:hypothetical protein [Bacillota bacterium]